MFRRAKDKLARTLAAIDGRAELLKLRSHTEALEKSHDIVLRELQKSLNGEDTDFPLVYAERYAFGLREGYQSGFVDGVHQYQIALAKRLTEEGVEFEMEDWDA